MRAMTKKEAAQIMQLLEERFPDAGPELDFTNPFELLIATILSAQTTDKQVNKVTPKLFERYPTPKALSAADVADIEGYIHGIGLYRNKAKNIRATAELLVLNFDGQVPQTMEKLVTLPGVGRKTANVVLSNAFDIPGIAVDTHVFRVSNRIGLSRTDNVLDCERELMRRLEKSTWSKAHHLLIFQGRRVCKAQRPLCEACNLRGHCRFFNKAL